MNYNINNAKERLEKNMKDYKELVNDMDKAVKGGDLEKVKELLATDIKLLHEKTVFGSWLHRAAKKGQAEVAKYLIDAGIDINQKAGIGELRAINRAIKAENMEIIRLLVEHNAVLDTSEANSNPLLDAIDTKNLEIVKYLIENGVDISIPYKLSYGDVNAHRYSTMHGTEEITAYLAEKMAELNIPVNEVKKRPKRLYHKNYRRNLDKNVLKELFTKAINESVKENLDKHKDETVFAMSFYLYYDAYTPEDRFQCVVLTQTCEACKKSKYKMDAKYIPDEYEYWDYQDQKEEPGTFVEISDYLFQNCLNMDVCSELDDYDEQDKMEEAIRNETDEIERLLAETVAVLRKQGIFKDKNSRDFYVFPYLREDYDRDVVIENAIIMNEGLDINEFSEYI